MLYLPFNVKTTRKTDHEIHDFLWITATISYLCFFREKVGKVGNTETTTVPTCYNYPSNPKIKLWDVPRVGNKTQGAATYWENMKLDKCDAYLILASGRFTENNGKLADKVRSVRKKIFFLRAKLMMLFAVLCLIKAWNPSPTNKNTRNYSKFEKIAWKIWRAWREIWWTFTW